MANNNEQLRSLFTDIADSIRSKTGETELINATDFPAAIDAIKTGGSSTATSAGWNDVTFIDYDGTVLYSYSLEEAQALTELPALPSHEGLICQGWNWSLADIKTLGREVTVGAMYITDDGATRLHIRIDNTYIMSLPLFIAQNVPNGVLIEWGDGNSSVTSESIGNMFYGVSHIYTEPGDYVISLHPVDGCTLSFSIGAGSTSNAVYSILLQSAFIGRNVTTIGSTAFTYCASLKNITIPNSVTSIGNRALYECCSLEHITIPDSVTKIENSMLQRCRALASVTLPNSVTSIGSNAFDGCSNLNSITLPNSVTSIGSNAFYGCSNLNSITLPNSVTSIGSTAFYECSSLCSVTLPNSLTSIGSSTFSYCYRLPHITIPASVTSIGNYAFRSCTGIHYYDFRSCVQVPTLSDKNAFNSIRYDCQMLIPSALYDTWKSATNWSTYAKYMVAV